MARCSFEPPRARRPLAPLRALAPGAFALGALALGAVALQSGALGAGASTAATHLARAEGWAIAGELAAVLEPEGRPFAHGWTRVEEMFGEPRAHGGPFQSTEPEILIETRYDAIARDHLRRERLHDPATLERLRGAGEIAPGVPGSPAPGIAGNPRIPPFPPGATTLLTAWWPVARGAATPLPVWDPASNPARAGGNHYLTWPRVVVVDTGADPPAAGPRGSPPAIAFAGRRITGATRVAIDRFVHVEVDADVARRSREDPALRKAAAIALGRPLEAGDRLVLVALHFARKRQDGWRWGTLWWHDRPDAGPFAADRPAALQGAWRNYLLDVPDPDAGANAAAPRPVFNPWLEARFADGGAGPGLHSDCATCHGRASYPDPGFLPVTRGPPDLLNDPAYAAGQLRTDFVWSIPRRAAPRGASPAD